MDTEIRENKEKERKKDMDPEMWISYALIVTGRVTEGQIVESLVEELIVENGVLPIHRGIMKSLL